MARHRIHLDTDLGGDADDLCALAMLLGDPDVELTGITTCVDAEGKRASMVRFALALAGREDIPVASGAMGFLGGMPHFPETQDERYWPGLVVDTVSAPGAALDLLAANAAAGATILAIGPYTNLALLETLRPGTLANASVVVMGGHIGLPDAGLPQWDADMDYNVQADRIAARIVFERADPLIVPLGVCLNVSLRAADLPALDAGGPLSRLVALQSRLHGADSDWAVLAAANPGLPADTLNIHWDPLACAAALGWDCVTVSSLPMQLEERADGNLRFREAPGAPVRRVVTAVDAAAFTARWLECVRRV